MLISVPGFQSGCFKILGCFPEITLLRGQSCFHPQSGRLHSGSDWLIPFTRCSHTARRKDRTTKGERHASSQEPSESRT